MIVVTGIHRSNPLILKLLPRLKIGIQTEQLYDEKKKKLWGYAVNKEIILKNLQYYDVVLELSPTNKPFYLENNISQKKIIFGPYIFPEIVPKYTSKPNGSHLFIGSLSCKMRAAKLGKLAKKNSKLKTMGEGSYGKKLEDEIIKSEALINVNMGENYYAPYPRLLKCIIYGKPMISEMLPTPFIKNIHFIDINQINPKKFESSHHNMSKLLCSKYNFNKFLSKAFKKL